MPDLIDGATLGDRLKSDVVPKNNISDSEPTTSNDITEGYTTGSIWTVYDASAWICINPAQGVANWQRIT